MTDTSREAVERLLDGVTPGPWYRDAWDIRSDGPGTGAICEVAKPNGDDDQYWKNGEADANARFIAAARELVPALLARAEAAEARLHEFQAAQGYRYIGRDMKPVLARDLEDRAEAAEAKLAKSVETLGLIDKAAGEVARRGAVTGPQWTRLTIALLQCRAALSEIKGESHD